MYTLFEINKWNIVQETILLNVIIQYTVCSQVRKQACLSQKDGIETILFNF